jgi:hypothetical protein
MALKPPKEIFWKWHLRYLITEMRLKTSKRPSSRRLSWGYLLQFWDRPDKTHASRGLLQVQPGNTLGKKIALHLSCCQDPVHNVARVDTGGRLPLFVSAR